MAIIRGRVVEQYTNQGVQGVLVSVGGQSAVTDVNGYFSVVNVPLGSYSIQVVHRNFRPYTTPVNVPKNQIYSLRGTIKLQSVVTAY